MSKQPSQKNTNSRIPQQVNEQIRSLEKVVIESNPDAFNGVPPEKRSKIIRAVAVSIQKSHSGPIPDPETLAHYNDIIPNGAERIMTMAEKQSDHRIEIEKKVLSGQLNQSNIGQFLAFIIGIFALTVSGYCISNGHEWGGSIIGAGGLTGLVTAFIKGKSNQKESLDRKK